MFPNPIKVTDHYSAARHELHWCSDSEGRVEQGDYAQKESVHVESPQNGLKSSGSLYWRLSFLEFACCLI